jgi:antitoxin component YwqK of YwqJK toxin-antitoxin module
LTGTAYSLHKNGKIEEECTMLNGLKHGICKYYNEEGEITDKIFYKNDEEKSRIIYTPSSEIHSVKLKDSQIQYRKYEDNTTTVYSPKKTKDEEFEIMFQESNEVISKTKMDSDSGSFLIFTNFNLFDEGIKYLIKEDLNEDWIHTSKLDKKGNNDSDNVYLDNKLFTGTGYFLHLNGRLCQAIKFKNGKQHGVSKEFDENGELFRRHYWVEGEMLFPT